MNEHIEQLYIFYADYGGYPIKIDVMDYDKYNIFNTGQPIDNRIHRATIHVDSTGKNDPILDIIVITEYEELTPDYQRYVSQQVVNWLFENGWIRS